MSYGLYLPTVKGFTDLEAENSQTPVSFLWIAVENLWTGPVKCEFFEIIHAGFR
jgi:hypothetical protein